MRHLRLAALVVGAMLVGSALYAQGTTPATKTVTCKDGNAVAVGKGACKDHGGYVKKSKKEKAEEKKEERKEEAKEEKAEKKAAKKP